jgi:hypothetical protein
MDLRHNYIGTEHILLGLIREDALPGVAERIRAQAVADDACHRRRLHHRIGSEQSGDISVPGP